MKLLHRCAMSFLFVVALGVSTLAHAASVSGQGTWEGSLQPRDLNGNLSTAEAYYDTSLNITWLVDANYAGTTMDWATANTWAANLNINGYTGWRLPSVTDTGTLGCNNSYAGGTDCGFNVDTSTGEMAHMFYVTLGDKAYCDPSTSTVTTCNAQTGYGLTNTGPFSNLQSFIYWSETADALNVGGHWGFDFNSGRQFRWGDDTSLNAWAVHSGDVGAAVAPIPAAVWLFGSGIVGLIGFARRRSV